MENRLKVYYELVHQMAVFVKVTSLVLVHREHDTRLAIRHRLIDVTLVKTGISRVDLQAFAKVVFGCFVPDLGERLYFVFLEFSVSFAFSIPAALGHHWRNGIYFVGF